jgi:hypothetical protein
LRASAWSCPERERDLIGQVVKGATEVVDRVAEYETECLSG